MVKLTNAEKYSYELVVSECAAQEGATDIDKEMIGMEIPTTKVGKCLHACIFDKLGLVSTR